MMNEESGCNLVEAACRSCWKPLAFERKESRFEKAQIDPVAKQLNEMSPEERRYVMEDIHGVAEKKKESRVFVDECLELFEVEIGKIKGKERIAYDMALHMNPSYVQNRGFRLKFLRADEFDVKNATRRIMTHFKYKLELFGKETLARDIEFDDLSSDVQGLLYKGSHQFLKEKDSQGRTIFLNFPELNVPCTWKNFARARWYQFMVALEEEAAQRHGFVVVVWWTERSVFVNGNMKGLRLNREGVPLRLAAVHGCFINYSLLTTQICMLLDVYGKKFQTRFRTHIKDSAVHCLYTLQSFGINAESVPLGNDGRPNKKWFFENLQERKVFERRHKNGINLSTSSTTSNSSNKDSANLSIIPSKKDVILGRGIKFSGNSALDELIDLEVDSYQKAPTNFDKTCITLATMRRVQASGGRFLKKRRGSSSKEWIVVDDDEARKTVTERFRNKAGKKISTTTVASITVADANTPTTIYKLQTSLPLQGWQQGTQYQLELLQRSQQHEGNCRQCF